jgi:hypothetical protein
MDVNTSARNAGDAEQLRLMIQRVQSCMRSGPKTVLRSQEMVLLCPDHVGLAGTPPGFSH